MTIIKHRDIRGLVGTLCGACIVPLVVLCLSAAPARAQRNFNPLPPQVAFVSDGKFSGTLQTRGLTLPITGTLNFRAGVTEYEHISVAPTGAPQITSDMWLIETPTAINLWETVSTFPKICPNEVLSGASIPQCTAWARNAQGIYYQKCTVTAQFNKTALESAVVLTADNKLVSLQESATLEDENGNSLGLIPVKDPATGDVIFVTDSLTITMTEQGSSPPSLDVFNRPGFCPLPNAPTASGNELACTGTIPSICF